MPVALRLAPFDRRDRVRLACGQKEGKLRQIVREVLQDLTGVAVMVRGVFRGAWNIRVLLAAIGLSAMVITISVPVSLRARGIDSEHPLGIGADERESSREQQCGDRDQRNRRAQPQQIRYRTSRRSRFVTGAQGLRSPIPPSPTSPDCAACPRRSRARARRGRPRAAAAPCAESGTGCRRGRACG
jgi:hypothetical protein